MWDIIFQEKIYISWICEFITALIGIFYLAKVKPISPALRFFIYYLIFIFFADVFGAYGLWAYVDDYRTYPFLKNSPFRKTEWWFNIVSIVTFIAIINLVISQLTKRRRSVLKKIMMGFIFTWILALVISNDFFDSQNRYVFLSGTFLLIFSTGIYLYEMINSDGILNFYSKAVFYIAVGAMLWHICVSPIWIYNNFASPQDNPEFFDVYQIILRTANVFLYCMFSLGLFMEYKYYRRSKRLRLKLYEKGRTQ